MQQLPTVYTCADGTKTLFLEPLNETYHSRNGAVAESMHVFINNALQYWLNKKTKRKIVIFEMGFGTGLNALLSLKECFNTDIESIDYFAIETNPLSFSLVNHLNYILPGNLFFDDFKKMHDCEWNTKQQINDKFTLTKIQNSLTQFDFELISKPDIVYFDAFAPDRQPELWTAHVFGKIFNAMQQNGVLTTYSSKGEVKRNLKEVGFTVNRLNGPPMKRHMLRAEKIIL